MSFSAVWHRRLKYLLTPQFDLYVQIGERFGGSARMSILDYGCGTGFGALQLGRDDLLHGYEACDHVPASVFGVDSDADAIEFAQEAIGQFVDFRHLDALAYDTKHWADFKREAVGGDGSFDLVTLIEVIEHMDKERQEMLVRALRDVMYSGSVFVVSTPNKRSQWRKHPGHIGTHDVASLRDLLAPHFSDVRFEDYLGEALEDDTTVSPLVAVCRGPLAKQ